jgi:ribosomal protein S18 acetylase RimI-like enzyme
MLDPKNTIQKEVQLVTRQSYRQAAQVLGRAFEDEPVSVAVYKNFSPARRIRALTVDFTAEIALCLRKGYPLQTAVDGKVIAVAVIYPPGTYPVSNLDQWKLLIQSIIGNGFYNIKGWLQWLKEVDHTHPKAPHFYLEYLGVDPEYQGKAYGSSMLQHLVNKADEEQVGVYLENANPRNNPFYQRFGFEVITEKEIIGIPSWFMWRPPVRKLGVSKDGLPASF